jgi:hypothetical protein
MDLESGQIPDGQSTSLEVPTALLRNYGLGEARKDGYPLNWGHNQGCDS